MHDQPKYEPLEKNTFFDDQRASRPFVEGTVARGHLRDNPEYFPGKIGDQPVTSFPVPVTEELVRRGQSRYNIFCTPCHDVIGNGLGHGCTSRIQTSTITFILIDSDNLLPDIFTM